MPWLTFQIDAEQIGVTPVRSLGELQTSFLGKMGHPVVLGATPIDSHASVFVVELLPAE
jgi:hypothetical protein